MFRRQTIADADELARHLDAPVPVAVVDPEIAALVAVSRALQPGVAAREQWRAQVKERMLREFATARSGVSPTDDAGTRDGALDGAHHSLRACDVSTGVSAHLADVEDIDPERARQIMAALAAVVDADAGLERR